MAGSYDDGYSAGWAECFEETKRRFFAGELKWRLPCPHVEDGIGTWECFDDKQSDSGQSFFCTLCGIRQQEADLGQPADGCTDDE